MTRGALYVLFTASGFAGLIYESIWTQYLKLFLGHAAYAQSLVLAVFMGGMGRERRAGSRKSRSQTGQVVLIEDSKQRSFGSCKDLGGVAG